MKKPHIIVGADVNEQLAKLCEFFGTHDLYQFIKKKNIELEPHIMELVYKNLDKKPLWESLLNTSNVRYFDTRAVDLLNKMLNMDPVI